MAPGKERDAPCVQTLGIQTTAGQTIKAGGARGVDRNFISYFLVSLKSQLFVQMSIYKEGAR